jgi:hypothetical protein
MKNSMRAAVVGLIENGIAVFDCSGSTLLLPLIEEIGSLGNGWGKTQSRRSSRLRLAVKQCWT